MNNQKLVADKITKIFLDIINERPGIKVGQLISKARSLVDARLSPMSEKQLRGHYLHRVNSNGRPLLQDAQGRVFLRHKASAAKKREVKKWLVEKRERKAKKAVQTPLTKKPKNTLSSSIRAVEILANINYLYGQELESDPNLAKILTKLLTDAFDKR